MTMIKVNAERSPHDLSSFAFTAGTMGSLKVLGFHPVLPGDGFETDLVGSMRLSPLRRGLAVDMNTQIFSFYVPYRMVYGLELWKAFLEAGPSANAPVLPEMTSNIGNDSIPDISQFLGTLPSARGTVPLWLYKGYEMIYNNYFKHPQADDVVYTKIDDIPLHQRINGFSCGHLPCIWSTAPLSGALNNSEAQEMDVSDGLRFQNFAAALSHLHVRQERENFQQRYRDLMDEFGGYANPDAEMRPTLLMRSEFWSSGYDINGTDQTSLGQFSGRVQQTFRHTVPRFHVPEHGVIIHLVLNRFPPITSSERHTLVSQPNDYSNLAGDPAIVGNAGWQHYTVQDFFAGGSSVRSFQLPHSQHLRWHPSHVDRYYADALGFPFYEMDNVPDVEPDWMSIVDSSRYNSMFDSQVLAQWNAQMKFNTTVYRRLPSVRETVLTAV